MYSNDYHNSNSVNNYDREKDSAKGFPPSYGKRVHLSLSGGKNEFPAPHISKKSESNTTGRQTRRDIGVNSFTSLFALVTMIASIAFTPVTDIAAPVDTYATSAVSAEMLEVLTASATTSATPATSATAVAVGAAAAEAGAEKAADAEKAAGAEETAGAAEAKKSGAVPGYSIVDGVVQLTLNAMFNRIKVDNEEYLVQAKRAEIYKRRLSLAMSNKTIAESLSAPNANNPESRLNWEKQRHTAWQTAELDYEKYVNDLEDKYDSIKSSLKSQYNSILDRQRNLKVYGDEMEKLEANISQTEAKIKVGQVKQSDLDSLAAQKQKLEADVASLQRDIDLAKLLLKSDLGIDFSYDIELADFSSSFIRYNDSRIENTISGAVGKDFSVHNSTRRLEILRQERAMMILFDKDGAFMTSLQENEISIRQTEYEIINAKNTAETGYWSSYYSILNQEDRIEIEKKNVKLAEDSLRVTSALLAQGMARQIDEQNDRISLEQAKITLQTAINDYMRMVEDFEASLK
ncbi:MAG: TolC family protein [Oscillospiraceae bacterium]|nr:TolC family protein [Oscillospiraceae bacterium]